MKTIKQYAKEIEQAQQSGDLLANLLVEMSSQYAYQVEEHTKYKLAKVKFEEDAKFYYTKDNKRIERDKPLSDKSTSAKWLLTKNGKKEYHLKKEISTLEKLMSNLKTIINEKRQERIYSGV